MSDSEPVREESVASEPPSSKPHRLRALESILMKYIDKAVAPLFSWWREVVEAALRYDTIETGTQAIKRILRKYSLDRAITEYIWNGFDADATKLEIRFQKNSSGKVRKILVIDNGKGIAHEELAKRFKPFYETEKELIWEANKNHSVPHGRTGVGRLTFFKFARRAKWTTVYEKNKAHFRYEIAIDSDSLQKYTGLYEKPIQVADPTGTIVEFDGIDESLDEEETRNGVVQYIKNEFAWFLELKAKDNFQLLVDGEPLCCDDIVEDSESEKWEINGSSFSPKYIRWRYPLNDEACKFYYLDSHSNEKFKDFTGLNRQGDNFNHSLYITSKYFDDFNFVPIEDEQTVLFGGAKSDPIFKRLLEKADKYLRRKRRPFLKTQSKSLIEEYQNEGIIPKVAKDEFESLRSSYLTMTLEELYVVQPRIFVNLNTEQKKTIVGFLQLLLDTDERERVLEVVSQFVELEPEDREEFSRLLRRYRLSYIIDLTHMLDERKKKVESLRKLVYDSEWKVKEEDVQELVEEMTWIFGEQYALLGSVDETFEVLLRKIWKKIHDSDEKQEMTSPDKLRQPDLLLCRLQKKSNEWNFVIIELKAPTVKIGDDQINQIEKYQKTVRETPQLNAASYTWDFILIGREFSESSTLESKLDSSKGHGENGLILKSKGHKIFIKNWADVFAEFALRHQFLYEKLEESKRRIPKTEIIDQQELMK